MCFGSFIVTGVVRVSVLRSATPLRSTGGEDDIRRFFGSCFNYARLACGIARKDFHSVLRLFSRRGRAVPSAFGRQDFLP